MLHSVARAITVLALLFALPGWLYSRSLIPLEDVLIGFLAAAGMGLGVGVAVALQDARRDARRRAVLALRQSSTG